MTDLLLMWKLLPICPSVLCLSPPTSPAFISLMNSQEPPSEQEQRTDSWAARRVRVETWTTTRTISPPTVPRSLTASLPVNQADPPWSTWATSARTLHGTIWCGRCATHCTWTSAAWASWLWSTPLRWEISFYIQFLVTRLPDQLRFFFLWNVKWRLSVFSFQAFWIILKNHDRSSKMQS